MSRITSPATSTDGTPRPEELGADEDWDWIAPEGVTLIAPSVEELGEPGFRLYEKARRASLWNAKTDIPWERAISLKGDDRQEKAWIVASQSVYAEQAGLLTAARLLNETDDVAIRLCLATAVSDEAKHSEVFARYALALGHEVAPMNEKVEALWEGLKTIDDPLGRFLVHTILEGFAGDEFTLLIKVFADDLLGTIYEHVRRDEKRHVIMGIDYLKQRLHDKAYGDTLRKIEEFEHYGIEIAGLRDAQFYVGLAVLTGRTPEEIQGWMMRQHQGRMRQILERR